MQNILNSLATFDKEFSLKLLSTDNPFLSVGVLLIFEVNLAAFLPKLKSTLLDTKVRDL